MQNSDTVINKVVDRRLCIGCGTCAGLCPAGCLAMEFNDYGEYNPARRGECNDCGLCLRACPFADGNSSEDELARNLFEDNECIAHQPACGYWKSAYVGQSASHRLAGASGGLATWALEALLQRGVVDRVITARRNPSSDKLFEFGVVDCVEQLRSCAGSVYYPLEMSQVIRMVLSEDARYAVVGLPCFLKGLRLAEQFNDRLRKRIVVHVGIVCSGLHGKSLTEYLIDLAGGDRGAVKYVSYREKNRAHSARDPLLVFARDASGVPRDGDLPWTRHGLAWGNRFFRINACNYCDDVFAELADAVFMDAWLPDYERDPLGNSLVITRSPLMDALFASALEAGELRLSQISIEKVIDSQAGVLHAKRDGLAVRLALLQKSGQQLVKRVKPAKRYSLRDSIRQRLAMYVQESSREVWARTRLAGLVAFHRRMPAYRTSELHRKLSALFGRITGGTRKRLSAIFGERGR